MAQLHVFDDDVCWWVAESIEDLKQWMCKEVNMLTEAEFDKMEYKRVADDHPLALVEDAITMAINGPTLKTKTAGEWAQLNGRGFLAGLE